MLTLTPNGDMKPTDSRMAAMMKVLQFTDSTFPVGTFSFSNGLETASYEKIVHDAATLEDFTRAVARQAAWTDGIAALHAHRRALADDYAGVVEADRMLEMSKMNFEARQMLHRMGKKLAELGVRLFPDMDMLRRWLADIEGGVTPGTYPVAQGIVFAKTGLSEDELYCSHQYGVVNMVLSAALRCVRVSHYDTQLILERLLGESLEMYGEIKKMPLEGMNAFVPETDICASLHEKGKMRMFMN